MSQEMLRDRSIDHEKAGKYVASFEEKADKLFVETLLQNTRYVSYPEFKQSLFESIDMFKAVIRSEPFFLLLSSSKIGSEHWLTALAWPTLRELNIQKIITSETPISELFREQNHINIAIIDDCIYSGTNVRMMIDGIIDQITPNENIYKVRFHIVIPYICEGGVKAISDSLQENPVSSGGSVLVLYYTAHKIPTLAESLYERILSLEESECLLRFMAENQKLTVTGDYLAARLYGSSPFTLLELYPSFVAYERFEILSYDFPCIYFDHKVATLLSTCSTVFDDGYLPKKINEGSEGLGYGSLLKQQPSREMITLLQTYVETCSLL